MEQWHRLQEVYKVRGPMLDDINARAPWHALYRRRTLDVLRELVAPDDSLLDLACGTGIFSKSLSSSVKSITLVDQSPVMLEIAKRNLGAVGVLGKCKFVEANIAKGEFETAEKFDVVLCTQALNFFSDLTPIFVMARSAMREGGLFYFDIDTCFRWVVIETMAGHLENALAIARTSSDVARNIVGADYYFHSRALVEESARRAGLGHLKSFGISFVSPLLHIFNQSQDFLYKEKLDARARPFLAEELLDQLYDVDRALEASVDLSAAGWMCFTCRASIPSSLDVLAST